jgi:hypothetical protein
LGEATRIDRLEIRWPNGAREKVEVSGMDRALTIIEGKGVPENQKAKSKE